MTPRLWTGRYTPALVLSVGLGALLTVLGFASATPMMRLMGTPEETLRIRRCICASIPLA